MDCALLRLPVRRCADTGAVPEGSKLGETFRPVGFLFRVIFLRGTPIARGRDTQLVANLLCILSLPRAPL